MKKTLPLIFCLYCLFLLVSVVRAETELRDFTSAKVCGTCHEAIYQGWKDSMHANSVKDPIFTEAFRQVSRETGGKTDALCLSCHAPTTRFTQDIGKEDPLTQEGITCDFCHSIKEIRLGEKNPFVLGAIQEKWGPLAGVSSPAHECRHSPIHEQAEFCATCHEFSNEHGVAILETYSEWKAGPYPKEGKTCQTCHMPKMEGQIVPPRVKPIKETYINSHEAAGGHSIETVKKAVTLEVGEIKRHQDKIHAVVTLENTGSGHKVPTGIPTRKLVLTVKAFLGNNEFYSEKRVFQKVVLDKAGQEITHDADLFTKTASIKEDTRLAPRKVREEHFSFLAPEGMPVILEAELYYSYQPAQISGQEMKVVMSKKRLEIAAPGK